MVACDFVSKGISTLSADLLTSEDDNVVFRHDDFDLFLYDVVLSRTAPPKFAGRSGMFSRWLPDVGDNRSTSVSPAPHNMVHIDTSKVGGIRPDQRPRQCT
jgi:hypothetical protein